MDENQKYQKLGFVLLMTAIIAVLTVCGTMLPGATLLVALVNTVLLSVFIVKSGFARAMAAPVLSLLVSFLVSGNIWIAVTCVLSFLLTGVLMALSVKHKFSIGKAIILVGVGFLAFLFSVFYIASAAENLSIAGYFSTQMKSSVEMLIQNMNALAQSAGNTELLQAVEQLQANSSDLVQGILQMIPSVLILMGAAASYLMVVITKSILKRLGTTVSFWKDFKDLRLDMAFSVLMVLSFIGMYIVPQGVVQIVLSNMQVIFMVLLSFCGFTFIDYFMVFKGLQKPLRVLVLLALLLLMAFGVFGLYFLSWALVLIGLLDSSLNFRRRINKGEGSDGQA